LSEVGFLVITGHGIPADVFDECRAAVRAFYALPLETKQRYRVRPGGAYRGWVGVGEESNAGAYGVDSPPDVKETFAVGAPDVDDERRALLPRWFAPNVYPAEIAEFRPAVERFMRSCRGLYHELLVLLARALRLDDDALTRHCLRASSSASLNWYPARDALVDEPVDGQFRIGPHRDYGTITILDRQRGSGGLEVKMGGQWVAAPWVDGSLTVNTGLLMGRWSNDRWAPNEHRVLPPPADEPTEELISLVSFHGADPEAVIEPLDGCWSADNPKRYEPVLAGEHLARMLDALAVDGR
jgi:isopenicillin N synthase-like dioxygenase